MSVDVMEASFNSFKIKEEIVEEEFEEDEFEEVDDEENEDDGEENVIEIVEIDENEIDYGDCVLMPYKDRIKTKPQITISAKRDFFDEKIYVPPSNCTLTIHERFTEIQTKLLKYQINPIFGIGGWNSLTYSGKKGKPSVFSRVGYYKNKRNTQYLAAMKLKKKSIKQLAPVVGEDGKTYSKGSYWRNKFKWFGKAATREELDEEIDEYMAKRGKLNESVDEENENSDEKADIKKEKKSFSMIQKIKQWAKNPAVTHDDLDKDLDSYMSGSKSKLDEELDAYMAEAAKAKSSINTITSENTNGITNGHLEGENNVGFENAEKLAELSDTEDMELSLEV